MNGTRPQFDSVALHALARRERSRLMAHLAQRLMHWMTRSVRDLTTPAAGRAVAR